MCEKQYKNHHYCEQDVSIIKTLKINVVKDLLAEHNPKGTADQIYFQEPKEGQEGWEQHEPPECGI